MTTFGNFGETALTGINQKLYLVLKERIAKVASGQIDSTEFQIQLSEVGLQTEWTPEELGLDPSDNLNENPENLLRVETAVQKMLSERGYDPAWVVDYLAADCPYELYWFDKTQCIYPTGLSWDIVESGDTYTVELTSYFYFKFKVAEEYAASDDSGFKTDTAKTSAASSAVAAAQQIVLDNASNSDYEKLKAYKDAICNLTAYNDEADDSTSNSYGNPWQLIWVFDGDASTNVVCEGYAKAFQYLCDLTAFTNNIKCYTVTGRIAGGTGGNIGGGHMWNIVTMEDGKNYLVDVTNCDTGMVGADDQLFLAGLTKDDSSGAYTFKSDSGDEVIYAYYDDTVSMYGEAILTLSSADYAYSSGGSDPQTPDADDGEDETGSGQEDDESISPDSGKDKDESISPDSGKDKNESARPGDEQGSGSGTKAGIVATGDDSPVGIYVTLMAASAGILIILALVAARKRKKS